MNTKQLSIFLENRVGRTKEVIEILSKEGINILAFTIADSAEFGILRLIVSDEEKALNLLKNAHISVIPTDVLWIKIDDKVGALVETLSKLEKNNISIEYMYICHCNNKPYIVIRPIDMDKCKGVF